jgi:DNA-binding XRE family transcriptional regulator
MADYLSLRKSVKGLIIMDSEALKRLEAAGWHSGTVTELFGLEKNLTQKALGKQIGSSQSRVAKIESGDPSVSMDLMFRCGFALGSSRRDLLLAISG